MMKKYLIPAGMFLSIALAGAVSAAPQLLEAPAELTALDAPAPVNKSAQTYIVQLTGDPIIAYDGGLEGYKATKPGKGNKVNPNSAHVKKYGSHLEQQHDQAVASVGAEKLYSYTFSFNGFAATMTAADAAALEARADVKTVWLDELRQLETNASPEFLGLSDPNGAWDLGYDGEGVIIGVIDTGIWPEHPSVSDQADLSDASGNSGKDNLSYGPPPADWFGGCQPGERISQNDCNNKLIGIKYYLSGFTIGRGAGNQSGHSGIIQGDFKSGRDGDDTSHGTHTATTAGGNIDVPANVFGVDVGHVSGIAHRARIASYKTCWNGIGCFTSDLVAAIDEAVADGVDVINYSIGSSSQNILAPDDIAFLFAADAGVFVATSGGNSGPGANTIGSPSADPWITTVAASTRTGFISAQAFKVNSPEGLAGLYQARESAIGRPISDGAVTGDLVIAEPLNGCDPLSNAADVAGKVAYVQRGACAFSTKHANAVAAGATAMVVFNNVGGPPIVQGGDFVGVIPGIMIRLDDGTDVFNAIVGGAIVNVSLDVSNRIDEPIDGNVMAGFSSRGPNGGAPNIIKPDVTAPGVAILAGIGEEPFIGPQGQAFGYRSGTSMSSPHVAGIGAILLEAHPDWSPAMVRSALVTTGRQDIVKENGVTPADPFDMGGGHVVPNSALNPGLVYDAGFLDYLAYLCGAIPGSVDPGSCNFLELIGFSLDPTNLNYPSIGVSQLVGSKTVKRAVTSVTPGTATYTVAIDAPPGINVSVNPSSITIDEGDTATYEVTFIVTDTAAIQEWAFGSLTWSDGTHSVRSPIAVRPFSVLAPDEVFGGGTEGSLSFDIQFGYSGPYTAGTHGLTEPFTIDGTVDDDPDNSYSLQGPGTVGYLFGYVPDTAYARFALFDEFTDGNDDLDLYIWACDAQAFTCSLIDSSGTPTSTEQVDVLLPEPFFGFGTAGTFYLVEVHGWQTDGPEANFRLFGWDFGLVDDRDNMTVTPPPAATLGATGTITVDWPDVNALNPGTKYLGAVSHIGPTGLLGLTLINISTE